MFSSNLAGFLCIFSTPSSLKYSIPFPYILLHSSGVFLALTSLFLALLFLCLPLLDQSIPTAFDLLQWPYPFSVLTASHLLVTSRSICPALTLFNSQQTHCHWAFPFGCPKGTLNSTDLKWRSVFPTPNLLLVLECLSQLVAPPHTQSTN